MVFDVLPSVGTPPQKSAFPKNLFSASLTFKAVTLKMSSVSRGSGSE